MKMRILRDTYVRDTKWQEFRVVEDVNSATLTITEHDDQHPENDRSAQYRFGSSEDIHEARGILAEAAASLFRQKNPTPGSAQVSE
jgi:hypothetical protein